MTTFNIGQMKVTIKGNTVKASHPTNEMKNQRSAFEIKSHIVTGEKIVVINDRHMNKNQSKAALTKIKNEILKSI